MNEKLRVLFVCMGNNVRSPMAEALLRHADSEHFEAYSAGIEPIEIDPRTLDALEHAGVTSEGLRSKSIDEFSGQSFAYLIDLCDKSTYEVLKLPHSAEVLVWNTPNPLESERADAFRHTLHEIHDRIRMFTTVKNRP